MPEVIGHMTARSHASFTLAPELFMSWGRWLTLLWPNINVQCTSSRVLPSFCQQQISGSDLLLWCVLLGDWSFALPLSAPAPHPAVWCLLGAGLTVVGHDGWESLRGKCPWLTERCPPVGTWCCDLRPGLLTATKYISLSLRRHESQGTKPFFG